MANRFAKYMEQPIDDTSQDTPPVSENRFAKYLGTPSTPGNSKGVLTQPASQANATPGTPQTPPEEPGFWDTLGSHALTSLKSRSLGVMQAANPLASLAGTENLDPSAKFTNQDMYDLKKQYAKANEGGGFAGFLGEVAGDPLSYLGGGETKGAEGLWDLVKGGAKYGTKVGALSGATQPVGEDDSRIANTAIGTFLGATTGTALPLIGKGLSAVKSGIGDIFRNVSSKEADNLTPEQLARIDLSKKYDVPLSAGDISQNPLQQSTEDAAAMGRRGEGAKAIADSFNRDKQQSYQDALGRVASDIGGGRELPETGAGAANAAKSITDRALEEKQAYKDAYDAANPGVSVPTDQIQNFANSSLENFVTAGKNKTISPLVFGHLKELNTLAENAKTPNKDLITGQDIPGSIDLLKLEGWRQGLNASINKAQREGGADYAMLTQTKAAFDSEMNRMIDNGLTEGDPALIDQLKKARSLRAQWGQKYQAKTTDDLGKKFVEDLIQNAQSQEPWTGAQIVNRIFGTSDIGFKDSTVNMVRELKNQLGKDSPEFLDLKLEAVNKLIRPLKDKTLGAASMKGDPAIATYRKGLSNLIDKNPELAKELFDPADLKALRELGDLGSVAFEKIKSKTNPTNSGYTAGDYIRRAFNLVPPKVRIAGAVVAAPFRDISAAADMQKAVSPNKQLDLVRSQNAKRQLIEDKLAGKPNSLLNDALRNMAVKQTAIQGTKWVSQ